MAVGLDKVESDRQVALTNVKVDLLCEVCPEEPKVALYHCEECKHNLCGTCEKEHHANDETSYHRVFYVENGVITSREREYSCGRHKSYLYCGICNTIICSKCVKRLHKRHGIHVEVPKAPPEIPPHVMGMLKNRLESYEKEIDEFDPETKTPS